MRLPELLSTFVLGNPKTLEQCTLPSVSILLQASSLDKNVPLNNGHVAD